MVFQAKKIINYAESGSESDEDDVVIPSRGQRPSGRAKKRRKINVSDDDDDDFAAGPESEVEVVDEGGDGLCRKHSVWADC